MTDGNFTLRNFRTELGLSQRAFAEEAGLSSVYMCQVETGRSGLGRDAGLAIVEAFRPEMAERRITLEDLLRDADRER